MRRLRRGLRGPHGHHTSTTQAPHKPAALASVLSSAHGPFRLPSDCGEKAPAPFTTTTSRSFCPSPTAVRETNGNLAGWPPGEKKSQRRVKVSLQPPEYKHAPAGRPHSLEPGRHLPARARAPAPGEAAPPGRAPTPPPNFRQTRLRPPSAAAEAEGWSPRGGVGLVPPPLGGAQRASRLLCLGRALLNLLLRKRRVCLFRKTVW